MRVLVTGGAGYIGSVAVECLLERGEEVIVLDNLWRGHAAAVPPGIRLCQVDLRDAEAVRAAVCSAQPHAVLHFAGAIIVPESVRDPETYFAINTVGSHNLLSAMRAAGVPIIVFSSTAAVYGNPARLPLTEAAPAEPINPYGRSKLMVEQMLAWHAQAYGLRYVAFRYFNVAGATATHGEHHEPETHIIPLALLTLLGKNERFTVFGTDYPTRDGTAVRDYVHVLDLVQAHLLALDALVGGRPSLGPVNLGTRDGFTVREVLDVVERVTGKPVPVTFGPRREGDAPVLIADSSKAQTELGWTPQHSTLEEMIGSAWEWYLRWPNGYPR